MSKKKMIISTVIFIFFMLLIIALICAFFMNNINVNPNSLILTNVQVNNHSVSFDYLQCDSGYSLKICKYSLDDNGTLTIRFWGTMFKFLSMKNSSNSIIIEEVANVKKLICKELMEL